MSALGRIADALEAIVDLMNHDDVIDAVVVADCEGCGRTIDAADLLTEGWRGDEDGYICAACASVEDLIERDVDDMIAQKHGL